MFLHIIPERRGRIQRADASSRKLRDGGKAVFSAVLVLLLAGCTAPDSGLNGSSGIDNDGAINLGAWEGVPPERVEAAIAAEGLVCNPVFKPSTNNDTGVYCGQYPDAPAFGSLDYHFNLDRAKQVMGATDKPCVADAYSTEPDARFWKFCLLLGGPSPATREESYALALRVAERVGAVVLFPIEGVDRNAWTHAVTDVGPDEEALADASEAPSPPRPADAPEWADCDTGVPVVAASTSDSFAAVCNTGAVTQIEYFDAYFELTGEVVDVSSGRFIAQVQGCEIELTPEEISRSCPDDSVQYAVNKYWKTSIQP